MITGSLLAGGGYVVYGGASKTGKATSGIVVTNNRFSRIYFAKGGKEGHVACFEKNGAGNIWHGNFWDDTGAPVSA